MSIHCKKKKLLISRSQTASKATSTAISQHTFISWPNPWFKLRVFFFLKKKSTFLWCANKIRTYFTIKFNQFNIYKLEEKKNLLPSHVTTHHKIERWNPYLIIWQWSLQYKELNVFASRQHSRPLKEKIEAIPP